MNSLLQYIQNTKKTNIACSSNYIHYDANFFSASSHITLIDIAYSEVVTFREVKNANDELTKAIRKSETNIVKDRFVKWLLCRGQDVWT
jgi:predicted DNA-binding ArsR family transcriptional regulator